jgi:cyanophycin synthetase
VLETLGAQANDATAHARWRALVCDMRAALGWPAMACAAQPVVRVCEGTTILAFSAPFDQLMLATEVNEWAWEVVTGLIGEDCQSGQAQTQYQPLHASIASFPAALAWFSERAAIERNPALMALIDAARTRHVPVLQDDDLFSLGSGSGVRVWALDALSEPSELPAPEGVPWHDIGSVPTLLVSGTNGKTTSVRLLAAMAKRAGRCVGYCCTEGVFVDGQAIESGDYSGPGGARAVLRQPGIDFAVLEMARGGILRRGLAIVSAQLALITNVSPEHFGEYGVDSIDDLADAKLVLAGTLGRDGTLVLNADDPVLLARAAGVACKLALFALDYAHPALAPQRAQGAPCCGVQDGRLMLFHDNRTHDLGAIAAMPLTMQGSARYNIANCAGAALSAAVIGIAPALIAQVLAQFGQSRHDNPGRLERWDLPGLTVLLDYAHNPEGLSGLLAVARGLSELSGRGRIGLLLGQAGNRSDDAIGELAAAAAQFAPDRIVIKDIKGYLRGRDAGTVPALLHAALLQSGIAANNIVIVLPEVDAACALLRWAETGDVLVLPVHDTDSKKQLQDLLDTLQADGWHCGQPLPSQSKP